MQNKPTDKTFYIKYSKTSLHAGVFVEILNSYFCETRFFK